MRRSLACFALTAGLVSTALAHGGGGYRGPPVEVPPDSHEPSDPPPPPDPPNWHDGWRAAAPEFSSAAGPARSSATIRAIERRAFPALRALLANEAECSSVRTAAVTALGRIGDPRDATPLARLAADTGCRRRGPAITELLEIP